MYLIALDAAYDNGVTKACQLGLMGVGIEKFNPNGIVTRAEFGTVLSRALWGDEYNGADPYYKDHLQALKDEGIMNIIDNPNMKEVRGYVMLMMMRADDAYTPTTGCSAEELLACILADDYESCIAACSGTEEEEVILPGFVTASRVGSVSTQTTAMNAVDKKVGTIKLTAGENDTTVSAIVIERLGLGQVDEIDNVQLYRNGEYVAELTTTRDNKFTVRFSPALVMKARSSMEFDVLVNLDAEHAGSTHSFSVVDVTVANWTKSGLPVTLGTLNVANYSVATGSVTLNAGTLETGKRWDLATVTVKPNTTAKIDWFTITAPEGTELTKMVGDVKAYISNEEVGNVTVNDETIIVKWLNIENTKTQTATIKIKADGAYVWEERTGTLSINTWHVVMFEKSTNERMSSKQATGTLKVKGADLKFENLTTKSQQFALWEENIELLNVKLTSSVSFDVNAYNVNFDSGFNTVLEDVYLYINGVDYPINNKNESYAWSKQRFTVAPNAPVYVKVKANVKDTFAWSQDFKVTFEITELYNAEEKTYVPVNTDNDITWHKSTISKGDYTLSKRTKPSSSTVKEGSVADVLFFNLEAKAEDQILSGLSFTYNSAEALSGIIEEVRLVKWSWTTLKTLKTLKDGDIDITDGDTVKFTDLSADLLKDEVTEFTLKVKLKDWEVNTLGSKFKFTLNKDDTNVVRKADDAVDTTPKGVDIKWTLYTIATDTPTVELTVDGKKVNVVISNPSSYDVELTGLNFSVLKSIVSGNIVNWDGVAHLKNVADEAVSDLTPAIPSNTVTFTGLTANEIAKNSSLTYVLEVEWNGVELTSTYFTAAIKWIEFIYIDNDTDSKLIKETY